MSKSGCDKVTLAVYRWMRALSTRNSWARLAILVPARFPWCPRNQPYNSKQLNLPARPVPSRALHGGAVPPPGPDDQPLGSSRRSVIYFLRKETKPLHHCTSVIRNRTYYELSSLRHPGHDANALDRQAEIKTQLTTAQKPSWCQRPSEDPGGVEIADGQQGGWESR